MGLQDPFRHSMVGLDVKCLGFIKLTSHPGSGQFLSSSVSSSLPSRKSLATLRVFYPDNTSVHGTWSEKASSKKPKMS